MPREISTEPPTPHFRRASRASFTLNPVCATIRQNTISQDTTGQQKRCAAASAMCCPPARSHRAVAETARGPQLSPPNRFPPVTREEAPHLAIELSILSPAQADPAGKKSKSAATVLLDQLARTRRGLLLPQVPVEHAWDRTMFLEQTCRKAGLPPDTWQKDAAIEAFSRRKSSGIRVANDQNQWPVFSG